MVKNNRRANRTVTQTSSANVSPLGGGGNPSDFTDMTIPKNRFAPNTMVTKGASSPIRKRQPQETSSN